MQILFNHNTIVILRLLHVMGGALWVGSSVAALLLFMPAIHAAEGAGQAVLRRLGPGFHTYMGLLATLTVLSGALLYVRLAIATGLPWIWSTAPGIGFTVGALAALVSFVIGGAILGPTQKRLDLLGAEMAAAGRPSAEQAAALGRLRTTAARAQQLDIVLLVTALGAMAVARYL